MEESTIELGEDILLRHRAMYQVRMEMAERAWNSATHAATVQFMNALQRRWSPMEESAAEDLLVQRPAGAPTRRATPRVVEGERALSAPSVRAGLEETAAVTPPPDPVHAVGAPPVEVAAAEHATAAGTHAATPPASTPVHAPAATAPAPRVSEWSAEIPGRGNAPLTWADRTALLKAGLAPQPVSVQDAAAATRAPGTQPPAAPQPASAPAHAAAAPPPPPPQWSAEIPGRGNAPLTWADRTALLQAGMAPQPVPVQDAAAPNHTPATTAPPQAVPAVPVSTGTWTNVIGEGPSRPLTWEDRKTLVEGEYARELKLRSHEQLSAGHPGEGGAGEHPPAAAGAHDPQLPPAAPHVPATAATPASPSAHQPEPPAHALVPANTPSGTGAAEVVASQPVDPHRPWHGPGSAEYAAAHPAAAEPARGAAAPAVVASQPVDPHRPLHGPGSAEYAAAHPSPTPTTVRTAAAEVVPSQPLDPHRPWHGPGSAEYETAHPNLVKAHDASTLAPGTAGAPAAVGVTPRTNGAGADQVHRAPPEAVAAPAVQGSSGAGAIPVPAASAQHTATHPNAPGSHAGMEASPSGAPAQDRHGLADEVSAQLLRRFAREMALEAERRGVVAWDY